MEDVIVTARHVRQANMCIPGAKRFFIKYKLQDHWRAFIKTGIHSSLIEATGDHMGLRVVEIARGKQ